MAALAGRVCPGEQVEAKGYSMCLTPEEEDNQDIKTQLAVIHRDLKYVNEQITDMRSLLLRNYVLQAEFEPVKKIVYGLVSLVLIGVVGTLMALLLNKLRNSRTQESGLASLPWT